MEFIRTGAGGMGGSRRVAQVQTFCPSLFFVRTKTYSLRAVWPDAKAFLYFRNSTAAAVRSAFV
jgi:hypothetical protein